MTLDVSSLSPSDAAVALRSYPRRFRAALTPVDPEDEVPDEAVAHAAEVGRVLAAVRQALARVLADEDAVVPAGVMDAGARDWTMPPDGDVERVLAVLAEEADGLAADIGNVASRDWGRTGRVAGGGEASALDLVREAVRTGHVHLRAAERAG